MKASSIALLYVPGAATRPEVRGGRGGVQLRTVRDAVGHHDEGFIHRTVVCTRGSDQAGGEVVVETTGVGVAPLRGRKVLGS